MSAGPAGGPATDDGPGTRERAGNALLAATAALLPLFPYGPVYLGLDHRAWGDLGVSTMLATCLLALGLSQGGLRSRGNSARASHPGTGIGPIALAWGAGLLVATGSLALGLARENVLMTAPFLLHLNDLPGNLWQDMNQVAHPLYPFRPWLTYAEGWGAFALLGLAGLAAHDRRARGRAVLYGATVGLGLVSVFAIFQYVTRFRLHPYWVHINPDVTRAHSTLDDPNALGSYLVLAVGVVGGLAWAAKRDGRRWLPLAGVALLGILAVGTTVSRVAWPALPMAAILVMAIGSGLGPPAIVRWARRLLLLGGLLLIVHLGLRVTLPASTPSHPPDTMVERVGRTFDPRTPLGEVLEHRDVWWGGAVAMMRAHPFTGVGLGLYPRLIEEYRPDAPAAENAHNFALQVGAESGWPGLLVLGLALATVLVIARPSDRACDHDRALRAGLLVGLVAFLLTNLTGHPLLLPSIQASVAVFLAGSLLSLAIPRIDRAWVGPLVGLALVLAVVALSVSLLGAYRATAGPPALLTDAWGYTWGLYAPETDPTGEFRWTAAEAALLVPVPEGARILELEYARGPRPPEARPVRVDLFIDGTLYPGGRSSDPAWTLLRLDLRGDTAPARATMLIHIDVRPAHVPADAGDSTDRRELGVMLRPPRFLR